MPKITILPSYEILLMNIFQVSANDGLDIDSNYLQWGIPLRSYSQMLPLSQLAHPGIATAKEEMLVVEFTPLGENLVSLMFQNDVFESSLAATIVEKFWKGEKLKTEYYILVFAINDDKARFVKVITPTDLYILASQNTQPSFPFFQKGIPSDEDSVQADF